ncbi:MAG: pilin [Pseudomonadota bacterium]
MKRTLINLMLAAGMSHRMRSTLEFGVAMALLLLLSAMAVARFESYLTKSQIMEAFSLSSALRVDMMVHRAQQGHWPETISALGYDDVTNYDIGAYVDHLDISADGALTAVFQEGSATPRLQGRRLTLRPLIHPNNAGAPVLWVCAQHQYVAGLVPGGLDETDIAPINLPLACRNY